MNIKHFVGIVFPHNVSGSWPERIRKEHSEGNVVLAFAIPTHIEIDAIRAIETLLDTMSRATPDGSPTKGEYMQAIDSCELTAWLNQKIKDANDEKILSQYHTGQGTSYPFNEGKCIAFNDVLRLVKSK